MPCKPTPAPPPGRDAPAWHQAPGRCHPPERHGHSSRHSLSRGPPRPRNLAAAPPPPEDGPATHPRPTPNRPKGRHCHGSRCCHRPRPALHHNHTPARAHPPDGYGAHAKRARCLLKRIAVDGDLGWHERNNLGPRTRRFAPSATPGAFASFQRTTPRLRRPGFLRESKLYAKPTSARFRNNTPGPSHKQGAPSQSQRRPRCRRHQPTAQGPLRHRGRCRAGPHNLRTAPSQLQGAPVEW
mmetsp:Transcript_84688/g.189227  ORF Transcript_84688/g.189227 Transcript_84688/m.189227 type:complete len:240 (-) Transcript_84688:56-775(-)